MLRYIGMYYLMGLVLNTGWAIVFTIWLLTKCNAWKGTENDNLYFGALNVFHNGNYKSFEQMLFGKDKKPLLLAALIGYTLWPINIATGLSRIPNVIEYINAEKERA